MQIQFIKIETSITTYHIKNGFSQSHWWIFFDSHICNKVKNRNSNDWKSKVQSLTIARRSALSIKQFFRQFYVLFSTLYPNWWRQSFIVIAGEHQIALDIVRDEFCFHCYRRKKCNKTTSCYEHFTFYDFVHGKYLQRSNFAIYAILNHYLSNVFVYLCYLSAKYAYHLPPLVQQLLEVHSLLLSWLTR